MLRHVSNVTEIEISETIEQNLISYYDYAFVNAGGYININLGDVDCFGNDVSQLRQLTDIRYSTIGDVWQGSENWVWEAPVAEGTPNSPQIEIGGSVGAPTLLDYQNGRVVVPAGTSSVRASYARKWVTFASADDKRNPLRLNSAANRPDLQNSLNQVSAEMTVPLPFVNFSVPPISESKFAGLARNYDAKIIKHNIKAYVFAHSDREMQRITDIFMKQEGYCVPLYCWKNVCKSGDQPLNFDGSLNTGYTHTELYNRYPLGELYLYDISSKKNEFISNNLHMSIINLTTKMEICGNCC